MLIYINGYKILYNLYKFIINKNNIEIKLSESNTEDVTNETIGEKKTAAAAKPAVTKAASVKNAPAKKINTPRKMA